MEKNVLRSDLLVAIRCHTIMNLYWQRRVKARPVMWRSIKSYIVNQSLSFIFSNEGGGRLPYSIVSFLVCYSSWNICCFKYNKRIMTKKLRQTATNLVYKHKNTYLSTVCFCSRCTLSKETSDKTTVRCNSHSSCDHDKVIVKIFWFRQK